MVSGPEVQVTDAKEVVSGRKAVLDLLGPGWLRHVTLPRTPDLPPGPFHRNSAIPALLPPRTLGLSVPRAAVKIAESPMPAPGRRVPDGRALQTSDEVSTGPGADPSGDITGPVSARVAPSSPFQPLNRWSVKQNFVLYNTCNA